MKCHYEVLSVARDADESEIKSAYKKLALKWHPDKNPTNPDEAKREFLLVQQAYEVLSDRQERAWYDQHRDQILKGRGTDYEDSSLDVFPYFSSNCFRGHGDDADGFYAVYRKVFEDIAKEEMAHVEKEEFCEIPGFGDSRSDYDMTVGPFYSYWMSYSTRKSYVWVDPFDINDVRQRKFAKRIEKENKKVRSTAKKERNEEIRNLVAFVRKRDKRVQANAKRMELKVKENQQRQEEISRQRRRERRKELETMVEQPEWAKFDNMHAELEEIEKSIAQEFSDGEESEEDLDLYCVACNKIFKTPKAFGNHESSKKHKENVELLKVEMMDDDIDDSEDLSDLESSEIEEETIKKKKNKRKKNVLNAHEQLVSENEEPVEDVKISNNEENVSNDEAPEEMSKKEAPVNHENMSKKSKRRNKDKNKPATNNENNSSQFPTKAGRKRNGQCQDNGVGESFDKDHCCVSCKAVFPSKNKLFDHLKKSGHSSYMANATVNSRLKKKTLK